MCPRLCKCRIPIFGLPASRIHTRGSISDMLLRVWHSVANIAWAGCLWLILDLGDYQVEGRICVWICIWFLSSPRLSQSSTVTAQIGTDFFSISYHQSVWTVLSVDIGWHARCFMMFRCFISWTPNGPARSEQNDAPMPHSLSTSTSRHLKKSSDLVIVCSFQFYVSI